MHKTLTLNVNGRTYELPFKPNSTLLDALREQIGLVGTKEGCDSGACGACTVLVDGEPALSCLTLTVRCQDKRITTIEGLAQNGNLHPLQESALAHDAVQCGFCTGGWLVSAKALLDHNPNPTREEIRKAIAGNLCRCSGYQRIEESILAAAQAWGTRVIPHRLPSDLQS